ncbi:MAG: hypothetical protein PHO18_06600 [Synergistaceae bacterium]|nr:hypothetical protein [Synergistaceae bacterium]
MEKKKSWHNEIDFRCSFGMWPFRRNLEITPRGFDWCGELLPLKSITRLRWGVDLRRGGIFPKRVYVAVFGTSEKEYIIKTKQKDFYEHLTDRYWKAVGRRLFTEMMDGLAKGERYSFGDILAEDEGITVNTKSAFSASKQNFYPWKELQWGIVNGSLCFVKREDPEKLLAGCSFLWVDNAHILNIAMGLLQNSDDRKKLSLLKLK